MFFIFALICWGLIGLWGSGWGNAKTDIPIHIVVARVLMGPLTLLIALIANSLPKCWVCGESLEDTEASCHHCHALRVE